MKLGFPLLTLLIISSPAAASGFSVRVVNAAATEELQLLELRQGRLVAVGSRRSVDGPDAMLAVQIGCSPESRYVVRGPGVTSPLFSCSQPQTELRAAASIAFTAAKSEWDTIAIERCDERRPDTRAYPVVRAGDSKLEAIVEAGCVIPTLFMREAAPEPLARFTLPAAETRSIPSPPAKQGASFRIGVIRDDAALENVEVQVVSRPLTPGAEPVVAARARTDSDGEARISGVSSGLGIIRWRAEDEMEFAYGAADELSPGLLVTETLESFPPTVLTLRVKIDAEVQRMMRELKIAIHRVEDPVDQGAQSAARTQVRTTRWARPQAEQIGEDTWRWTGLQPGEWQIESVVMLGRGFATGLADVKVTLQPGESRTIEVEGQLVLIKGRIRTPTRSLQGHQMRFEPFDRRQELTHTSVPILADNEFAVLALPGTYRYGFQPRVGAATWLNEKVEVTSEGATLVVDLPTGEISGTIRHVSGRPVEQCGVGGTMMGASRGTATHQTERIAVGTSHDGTYRIESVPAGTWRLSARCGGARAEERIVAVGDSAVEGVDFEVGGDELFVGRLQDAAGAPVAHTYVIIAVPVTLDGRERRVTYHATSDSNGALQVSMPEGSGGVTADVTIRRPRTPPASSKVVIEPNFVIVVP